MESGPHYPPRAQRSFGSIFYLTQTWLLLEYCDPCKLSLILLAW